jgi:hypothetical protein
MPRSHGIIHVAVWEVGSDFRAFTLDTQWAYEMLISQPAINNLGLLPYTPEKWWRFASDLTVDRLTAALETLEDARMTVTDPSTGELLVRTFIKHDRIWKHSKLVTNARKLIREVESGRIRDYLLTAHPWLLEHDWTQTKIEAHETGRKPLRRPPAKPQTEPQPKGQPTDEPTLETKGQTEGVTGGEPEPQHEPQTEGEHEGEHDGVSSARPREGRVRDGLGLPQDQPLSTGSKVNETRAVAAPVGTALASITPELPSIS